jgi:hypothetical protein
MSSSFSFWVQTVEKNNFCNFEFFSECCWPQTKKSQVFFFARRADGSPLKCLDLPEVLPVISLMYRDAKRKWTGLRFVVLSKDQSAFVYKTLLTF